MYAVFTSCRKCKNLDSGEQKKYINACARFLMKKSDLFKFRDVILATVKL